MKLQPVFRLALEGDKHVVLDQKDALLLRRISETHSLTEGAKMAGMSYRNAWDRIRAMESNLGKKIIVTKVGGVTGGGDTVVATPTLTNGTATFSLSSLGVGAHELEAFYTSDGPNASSNSNVVKLRFSTGKSVTYV